MSVAGQDNGRQSFSYQELPNFVAWKERLRYLGRLFLLVSKATYYRI